MSSYYTIGIMTASGGCFWRNRDEFANKLSHLIFNETTFLVNIIYEEEHLLVQIPCSNLNLSIFYSETIKKYFEDRFNINRLQVEKDDYDSMNPDIKVIHYKISDEQKAELETLLKMQGANQYD